MEKLRTFDVVVPGRGLVVRAYHDGKALHRSELRGQRAGSRTARPDGPFETALRDELLGYFGAKRTAFSIPLAWHGRPCPPKPWQRRAARDEQDDSTHAAGQHGQDAHATTPFQRAVWDALRAIPYGETRSYGELARAIGKPGAARAVGAACGANPWPIIVPCHRVIAADGALGGYSAGLKWKRVLLELEGTRLDGPPACG